MPGVNGRASGLAQWVWPVVGVVGLALLPLALPSYWLYLATSILISSLLALSVGLVTGSAGMVSLCQLSFAGLAGWLVSYFNANDVPLPFLLQVLIAPLCMLPLGALIGLPALRVRGVNLAVVTLAFASVTDLFFARFYFPGLLASDEGYYWFCLVVFVLVTGGFVWISQQRLGSVWLAVKHSERAAAAMGLSVSRVKLSAFAVSAVLEGNPVDGLDAIQRVQAGLRRSFQLDRTIPDLSARNYLNLSAGRTLNREELAEALQFAHVTRPDVELHSLNVGTRRLLEVAALVASKPKIVLLDEPAAGLNSEESLALGHHIARIPGRYGCAILLTEHDMALVRIACSNVTVFDFGSMIAQGRMQRALALPEVIRAYLGED